MAVYLSLFNIWTTFHTKPLFCILWYTLAGNNACYKYYRSKNNLVLQITLKIIQVLNYFNIPFILCEVYWDHVALFLWLWDREVHQYRTYFFFKFYLKKHSRVPIFTLRDNIYNPLQEECRLNIFLVSKGRLTSNYYCYFDNQPPSKKPHPHPHPPIPPQKKKTPRPISTPSVL